MMNIEGMQPLSLEQMKEMGGQPYWHVGLQEESPPPHWEILDPFYAQHIEDYGYCKRWLAYAYPPIRAKGKTLNCAGCDYLDRDEVPCAHCIRATKHADYYKPQQPPK